MKPSPSSTSVSPLRRARQSPLVFWFLALALFFVVLYSEDLASSLSHRLQLQLQLQPLDNYDRSPPSLSAPAGNMRQQKPLPFAIGTAPDGCDYFSGRWVKDDLIRHPLYEESQCPYIQPQLTCQHYGRPDKGYQQWRWQPHGCSLPSFNVTMMLEALRGKRLLFVGDSLNRGQYVSLICLLQTSVPEGGKAMEEPSSHSSLTVFRLKDYNATIEFYWAPFLLESNSDNAIVHRVTDRIVRKGSINKHGTCWKGADIVVFNTYLWWITGSKTKILKGSFDDEVKDIVELETEDAYRMAMKNVVRWIQKNVDLEKTRVFFTSMSPTHTNIVLTFVPHSAQWNEASV